MAEALGIFAASLQISELLAKVVIRSAKLVSELKHASEEVKQKAQSLEDFRALHDSIQDALTQHESSLSGVSVRREDFDYARDLIIRVDNEAASLEKLIHLLTSKATDKRLDTWWKAAKTLQKRSEIITHLDALSDAKSQINGFFLRSTFSHLVYHSTKNDATLGTIVNEQVHGRHTLSQIERRQITDRQTLVSIQTTVAAVGDSHQASTDENRNMHQHLQAELHSLQQQSAESANAIIQSSSATTEHIDHAFNQIRVSLAGLTLSDESVRLLARQLAIDSNKETDSPQSFLAVPNTPVTTLSSICPCRRKGTKETLFTLGPVSVVRRQFGKHSPACPFSERSNSNIKTRVSPELSYTFRQSLAVSTSWYAATATSFLRGALHLPRIIDIFDPVAPGFKHFRKAHQLLEFGFDNGRAADPKACSQLLIELHNSLADDFNMTGDWANIQDQRGNTLLHELRSVLHGLHHVDDSMSYILDDLVQLLIKGGTPLDAVARNDLSDNSPEPMITAFDRYLLNRALFPTASYLAQEQSYTTLFEVFMRNNLPTFALYSCKPGFFALSSVMGFHLSRDLAIEYGCSRIVYSVITKDKDRLQHLLWTGHSSNGNPEDPTLPPLCYAHSWPTGTQILLEATANPEAAVVIALHYELTDFLETLLKHDLWLNDPRRILQGNKMMEEMWNWFSIGETTLVHCVIASMGPTPAAFSIIRAAANARSELMRLAIEHLSSSQLQDLGWTPANYTGCLIESAATATYGKLQLMGVELKKRHFPGRGSNMFRFWRVDVEMADFLWHCGFRELDITDENGLTPLILHAPGMRSYCMHQLNSMLDLLIWFLEHGASKATYPELNHMTFLHKTAASLGPNLAAYLCNVYNNDSCYDSDSSYDSDGTDNSDSNTDSDSTGDTYDAKKIGVNPQRVRRILEHPVLPQRLPQILAHPTVLPLLLSRDQCDCFCSGGVGCSPITSFAKAARSEHRKIRCSIKTSCHANRDIIFLWKRHDPRGRPAGCTEFTDLCRVELFERLGMRHTCCQFQSRWDEPLKGYEFACEIGCKDCYGFGPLEAAEFQEEDHFFHQKLEAFMALYEELSTQYDDRGSCDDAGWENGPFRAFWDTWWKVVQEYLPEDSSEDWSESSSGLSSELDENSVVSLSDLSTDEKVGEIRRHVQRSMELNGYSLGV